MNVSEKYIYERFNFSDEYKQEIIELFRHFTNVEIGGYRIWDGQRNHLMQSPWELADFIFALKEFEKENNFKFRNFLEIGFSSGINNTILNKFFKFNQIVGIDIFSDNLSGENLLSNMTWKNLILIVGDSTEKRTLEIVKKLGSFELIFIDANHTYEYVKKDFENYKNFLSPGGIIAFHDIDCPDFPGVKKFWEEIKSEKFYDTKEFISMGHFIQYGIGMVSIK